MVEKIFTTEFSRVGGGSVSVVRPAAFAAPFSTAMVKTPTAKKAIRLGSMNNYCVLFSID
jgi:hypothetical protein